MCVAVVDGGPSFYTVTLVFTRRGTTGGCVLGSDTLIAFGGRLSIRACDVSSSGDGDRKRGGGASAGSCVRGNACDGSTDVEAAAAANACRASRACNCIAVTSARGGFLRMFFDPGGLPLLLGCDNLCMLASTDL